LKGFWGWVSVGILARGSPSFERSSPCVRATRHHFQPMRYRVSMSEEAARLLEAAPADLRATVLRCLQSPNVVRPAHANGPKPRLVFIFDEPMLLLEIGPYLIFYEYGRAAPFHTVRVRHLQGPPLPDPRPQPPRTLTHPGGRSRKKSVSR